MKEFGLGQHFLRDKSALHKIVDALDLQPEDTVVEIGAGHGELTSELARQFQILNSKFEILNNKEKIVAVEKDRRLFELLAQKFADNENIEIICGDALKILPQLITQLPNYQITNYKICGNIPYYITGYLLRILSELKNKPSLCVFTLQKEVAERICASATPGRRKIAGLAMTKKLNGGGMNRLAAITQFWAKPTIIADIPKESFQPMPGVASAIIKFNIKEVELPSGNSTSQKLDPEKYYKTVKVLFQQPRKTILNNIANDKSQMANRKEIEAALVELGINPKDRPQNLGVEEIVGLAQKLF